MRIKKFFSRLFISALMGLLTVNLASSSLAQEMQQADDTKDKPLPVMKGRGGVLAFAKKHNFVVESEWEYPFVFGDRFYLSVAHRDSTPFLNTGGVLGSQFQVEILHSTESLRLEFELNRGLAVKTVQRYEHTRRGDRPGHFYGYEMGFGIGSPQRYRERNRFDWELVGGPFFNVGNVKADWFLMGRANWDVVRWKPSSWMKTTEQMGLLLEARFESVNDGDNFRPEFEVGPTLRLHTLGGNQFDLFAHWYQNALNPFGMRQDGGLLIGMQFNSSREPQWGHDLLDFQAGRIFSSSWARYDAGFWDTHTVTTFETKFDVFEFNIFRAPMTLGLWYQHRQEFQEKDFDNTSYTVVVSMDTPVRVPLLSDFAARKEPLAFGLDFVHRSDHALDPPASRFLTPPPPRVTPLGNFLRHSNVNIWRFHLQTLGWDEPYRYKEIYERQTRWVGLVDWRITLGFVDNNLLLRGNRQGNIASQIGMNVDVVTIQGFVPYVRGQWSLHQETPDGMVEFGIKRPTFRVFGRWEDFAIAPNLSRGGTFYLGFGVNL